MRGEVRAMRLIDADALVDRIPNPYEQAQVARWVYEMPSAQPTTTWLGNYSPYTCEKCGFHVDSKTRFCPDCGRRATNYD